MAKFLYIRRHECGSASLVQVQYLHQLVSTHKFTHEDWPHVLSEYMQKTTAPPLLLNVPMLGDLWEILNFYKDTLKAYFNDRKLFDREGVIRCHRQVKSDNHMVINWVNENPMAMLFFDIEQEDA